MSKGTSCARSFSSVDSLCVQHAIAVNSVLMVTNKIFN